MYRLYTDKISTDGRKIPYLKKGIIFKLMKTIARSKSVAVYIESKTDGESLYLICEFDENGFIKPVVITNKGVQGRKIK